MKRSVKEYRIIELDTAQFSIAKPFGTNSILEDKKLRQRSVNFENLCNTSIVRSIIDAEWSRKISLGTI